MRGMPSRSAGGSEGAPVLPASIDGELDCRWKSPDATYLGSAEMLPAVPSTAAQLPDAAGPAELKRSLWTKTGPLVPDGVRRYTPPPVLAELLPVITFWTMAASDWLTM